MTTLRKKFWRYESLGFTRLDRVEFSLLLTELNNKVESFCHALSYDLQITAYEEMDLFYDRIESFLSLMKIESSEKELDHYENELSRVIENLSEKIDAFFEVLEQSEFNILPFWCKKIVDKNDVKPYEFATFPISKNGRYVKPLKQVISQFSDLDQGLLFEKIGCHPDFFAVNRYKNECCIVSREYFSSLSKEPISLFELRQLERQTWANIELTFDEAIDCISKAFSKLCLSFSHKVNNAVAEGRIRLIENVNSSMFCFDSPCGSYIQTYFDGTLESFTLLAHEFGHLVHQESVREKYILKQSICPKLSEAVAIAFENIVVEHLMNDRDCADIFQKWRSKQKIEWFQRHWMLSYFERGLYRLDHIKNESVCSLWMDVNREFYPDNITFDESHSIAWKDIPHLFQTPFYLTVYPVAYLYAEELLLNPKTLIDKSSALL